MNADQQKPGQAANTQDVTMHYSFDYLQQVHYPTNSKQASAVYFLTRRKCSVFIVSCESSGRSVFYLIDETDNYGKGADATCSLFHRYLPHHALGEKHLALHFDNCHEPTECYDSMCEARRKASSDKALLLFLVTCMHDVMHAVCMLCAIWRTTDTVTCGTE